MKRFRLAIIAAVVGASVASPILIWRHSRALLANQNERLHRQAIEIATLEQGKRGLTNNALSGQEVLSEGQLRELLRLRAEAAALKRQTNDDLARLHLAQTGPETPPFGEASTPPQEQEQRAAELAANTLEAMKGVLRALPEALQRFAQDHNGKMPADFPELRKYFPQVDDRRMPGLYTFQFVREEGPQQADALILKEQSWRERSGQALQIYGFRNGEAVEVTFPDDDHAQHNFANWEREHLGR